MSSQAHQNPTGPPLKRKSDVLHLGSDPSEGTRAEKSRKRREPDAGGLDPSMGIPDEEGNGIGWVSIAAEEGPPSLTRPEMSGDHHQISSLRQHSRQEYLAKRELQQLELLRTEIADEQALFLGTKVSRAERSELDRKKQLLSTVEERLAIDDSGDGYRLPDEYLTGRGEIDKKKKHTALYQRYQDAQPMNDQFVTDIDHWESIHKDRLLQARIEDIEKRCAEFTSRHRNEWF
jgi:hypothetical protein